MINLPYILANAPGNKPDADKFMANYDWLFSMLHGNFLSNGGMESWSNGTSFPSVASGVAVADGWQTVKTGTTPPVLDIEREATIKDSGTYSLKMVMQTAGSTDSQFSLQQEVATPAMFSSQTMVFSVNVKCATASKLRLMIYDGTTTAYSAYHPGDGQWHRLLVSITCSATPSNLRATISIEPSDFNGDTIYIDSAFLYVIPSMMSEAAKAALVFNPINDAMIKIFSSLTTDTFKLTQDVSLGRVLTADASGNGKWRKATAKTSAHQIYCLGDSLTFGFGSGDMGIVHRLRESLGNIWDVNNNGISGNNTTQMLARLNTDILDHKDAEYVLVWGGTNDIYQDVATSITKANLQAIYNAIHAAGAKVVALYIPPSKGSATWNSTRQAATDDINAWIAGTATNIDYKIDVYTLVEDPANADKILPLYDSGDHLHLQQDGYFAVADAVFSGVASGGGGLAWMPSDTTRIDDSISKKDGWSPIVEAWAYYGVDAFFTDVDARTHYQKGDKIKVVQGTTAWPGSMVKYFYIRNDLTGLPPSQVIPVSGGNDYSVANLPVIAKYVSKADNPQGFPHWFAWTPVLSGTGGSAGAYAISVQYASFRIVGKTAEIIATFSITNVGSWTGNVLLQLPLIPSTKADNSVQLLQQGIIGANGGLTIQAYTYDIDSAGKMRFVSALNSTILAWAAGLANSAVSIKATFEI
jgi:lysophospholipase L1-like esterase